MFNGAAGGGDLASGGRFAEIAAGHNGRQVEVVLNEKQNGGPLLLWYFKTGQGVAGDLDRTRAVVTGPWGAFADVVQQQREP